MQFYEPSAFVHLWTIPALILILWTASQFWKNRLKKIGNLETIQTKLLSQYRPSERRWRAVYLILVFLFGILALARPQWGDEQKKIERKGVDLIFLLDTSLSMLAEDAKPNRLEKSKLEIKSFLRQLKGDRVGMVAFAGSSFLQTPLTLDYAAFQLFLDAIKTGYVPDPGTSLDRAIRLAVDSFPEKDLKHKAIILFSDGEDHEGGMDNASEAAKKANVRIYTIGLGSAQGEPIPLTNEKGGKTGFKKDREGNIVITRLNQELLEKIAAETGGVYLPSTPSEKEVEYILKHMETLGKRQFKERLVSAREDHYQAFLLAALFFLVIEMLVRRTGRQTARQRVPMIAVFLLFTGFFSTPQSLNKKGNELFEEKKYQSAIEEYQKAKVKDPDNSTINYNLGTTLYQADEYQESSKQLEKALAAKSENKELQAKVLYNFANTQYRLGNFEKAIESYEKALEIDPNDKDAKYNLEFLTKKKNMFDKKNEDRKENQKKEPQDQQKDQQNQNQQQQQEQQQQQNQQNQQQQDQQKQDQEDQQQDPQQDEQQKQQQEQQEQRQEQEQQQNQQQQERQNDGQQDQQQQPDQQQQNQPQQGRQEEGRQEPEKRPGEQAEQQKAPLQGQMKLDNALRILEALKEGEKELLDLRRPPPHHNEQPPPTLKDW